MNSAHASLLQWLQERPGYRLESYVRHEWVLSIRPLLGRLPKAIGFGPSYEAACYDLLQQLKK